MDTLHVLTLALVQGLTEFLPISSSAHLILVPSIVDWPDQGLAFDVAVHVGTLAAVVGYFRAELARMAVDWYRSVRRGEPVGESAMVWLLVAGTVPVSVVGLLVNGYAGDALRSPFVIALATIAFAVPLWWADRRGRGTRGVAAIGWRDAVIIGLAQAFALVPGASRSGVTMMAGLALGLTREAASRFSFLLSIPVIVLAGGLKTFELAARTEPVDWVATGLGAVVSGLCAYLCIRWFLALVERIGFTPFVVYRLLLGVALLAWVV